MPEPRPGQNPTGEENNSGSKPNFDLQEFEQKIPARMRMFKEASLVITKRIEQELGHTISSDGEKEIGFDDEVVTELKIPSIGLDSVKLEFCRLPGFNIAELDTELLARMDNSLRSVGINIDKEDGISKAFMDDAKTYLWGNFVLYADGSPLVVEGDEFDPSRNAAKYGLSYPSRENLYRFVMAPELPPTVIQARPWRRLTTLSDCLKNYPNHRLTDEECERLLALLATVPLYKEDD